MKKVILLFIFLPLLAKAQVLENFEPGNTGNWTQIPAGRWQADTVLAISGTYSLHHTFDNVEAATDMISIPLNNLYVNEGVTEWAFSVRYGYSPSASNNWVVFLLSGNDPSNAAFSDITGYAAGVNFTGYDDTLRIWKVMNGNTEVIVKSRVNWQNDIGTDSAARITVKRSPDGIWSLITECLDGSYADSSSGYKPELISPGRFIITYRYTSSCDRLLWFDDISIMGVFHEDNRAPSVTGCEMAGHNQLYLTLDEVPAEGFENPDNFSLNDSGSSAVKITRTGPLTWSLDFENEFKNKKEYSLEIRNICDSNANCMSDTTVFFSVFWPEAGDVIISEIMADPEPEVSLPASEYVELTNRTDFPVNIKNWRLLSGTQVVSIPECNIAPGSFLLLCAEQDTAVFGRHGSVLGIKPFPVLTDAGKLLCLSDSNGTFIHGVEYSDSWYGDELRSSGGWSLEMIDTDFPFYNEGNWKASIDRSGGTPGKRNSVTASNPDLSFYGLKNAFPYDNKTIKLVFPEYVPSLEDNPGWLSMDGNEITSIKASDALSREYAVTIAGNMSENEIYEINLSDNVTDFAGNRATKRLFRFGLPVNSSLHDVLFNELLFNPLPGDPDYIEVYNASDNIINISRLVVVSVNDDTGDTSGISSLSGEDRCLLPGSYYAFTTGRGKILQRYFSSDEDNLFEVPSLPSMPDNSGHLILFSRELDLTDEVFYNDKMHNSLLAGDEGVSLEKAVPGGPSGTASEWHSSTEYSGWGTPGAPNSVLTETPVTGDAVTLTSTLITPDGDGIDDLLGITLKMTGSDNIISAEVFDAEGDYIRKITGNMLAGSEAVLTWDGTADNGSNVRNGIYIILITIYNENGKTERFKKVCSVVRR